MRTARSLPCQGDPPDRDPSSDREPPAGFPLGLENLEQECIPVEECISRMRTPACCPYLPACTAPVWCTWLGGVPGLGGCTWSWGVYLVREGVPGPGGMVYLVRGCTWSQGSVPGPRGVPGPGVYLVWGGGGTCPGLWTESQTPSLRAVKMGRYFPVREKSGNFEQNGKVRENHTK